MKHIRRIPMLCRVEIAVSSVTVLLSSVMPAGAAGVPLTERAISTEDDYAPSVFATDLAGDGDVDVLSASSDRAGDGLLDDREFACQANELQKVIPSDGDEADRFGNAVAISGDCALVASPFDDEGDASSGSVYVLRLDGVRWREEAKLVNPDPESNDWFGFSVALDGYVALIGAIGDSGFRGAAYVYRFDGNDWVNEAKLTAPDAASSDQFGYSVAISGDVAMVGAHQDDDVITNSGSVYVYRSAENDWSWEEKITASDPEWGDRFGHAIALDGGVTLITALLYPDRSGKAYVFRFDSGTWNEETKLTAFTPASGGPFARPASLSGDVVMLGMPGDDGACPGDPDCCSGAVLVFRYDAVTEEWLEEGRLTASDAGRDDDFGRSVSLRNDLAVVGAPHGPNAEVDSGSAYVYRYDGGTWVEEAKLASSDADVGDYFGGSVSFSGDVTVIGSSWDDDLGSRSGSVYFYGGLSDCNGVEGLDICEIAGGAAEDCNVNGTPDDCDIDQRTSQDLNTNGIPDECVSDARSCKSHDVVGRLCLGTGQFGGIEPRLGGVQELEIDLDTAVGFSGGVAVDCSTAWVGDATGVANGDTVTVTFAPALPDQADCTIELDCGASVCVRSCEGDLNLSGQTTIYDALEVKVRLGQAASEADCEWDFNCSGRITTADYLQVKLRFGHAAPDCP